MAKIRSQKDSLLAFAASPPPLDMRKNGSLHYDPLTCPSTTPPTSPLPPPSPSPRDMADPSNYENDTLLNNHSVNMGVFSGGVSNGGSNPATFSAGNQRSLLRTFEDDSSYRQQQQRSSEYQQRERAATEAAEMVEQGQPITEKQQDATAKQQKKDRRYTTLF